MGRVVWVLGVSAKRIGVDDGDGFLGYMYVLCLRAGLMGDYGC